MNTDDFDFSLPEELISLRPREKRDASRLLVLHGNGRIEHGNFFDLPGHLRPGDMLVLNRTKVFPARLGAVKQNGGRVEILLVGEKSPGIWNVMSRGRHTGKVVLAGGSEAFLEDGCILMPLDGVDLRALAWDHGDMPLPPYIKRAPDRLDRERYQTVYASDEGSIAAPTAGLHFTDELIAALTERGVLLRSVVLHVGTGTFRPVKTDRVEDHRMDEEFFEIDSTLLLEVSDVKASGGRVITVGTTTTRALEGYASGRCRIISSGEKIRGTTDIFIYEGYRPLVSDALITNFHLPKSTPLMLASVFAGRERLLSAYSEAIARGYGFFSYGDAMLVL